MKKLLVFLCIMSVTFSPFAWAEDEVTTPSTDTTVVVETILDPSPVIETTEQTQTPIDASISPESETSEQALPDISQASEEVIMAESLREDTAIVDETIHSATESIISADSLTPIVDDIEEISTLDSIIITPSQEEKTDETIVSDTDIRTIMIDAGVVTVQRK